MSNLTDAEIAEIISENARLKAQVRYYAGENFGKERNKTPVEVIEKYGRHYSDIEDRIGFIIRRILFPNTVETTKYLVKTKKNGIQRREKTSCISIKNMTDAQYEVYSEAYIGIFDLLYSEKKKIEAAGGNRK